jgi:hypothetical protein
LVTAAKTASVSDVSSVPTPYETTKRISSALHPESMLRTPPTPGMREAT